MLYKDYWINRRLRYLKDAGILWKTPVDCPTDSDGTKLWTTALRSELGEQGLKTLQDGEFDCGVRTHFAMCKNGHRHDL